MPDKRVTEWIKSKCHFLKLSLVNTAWGNISFPPELQLLESGKMAPQTRVTSGEPHSCPAPCGKDQWTVLSHYQLQSLKGEASMRSRNSTLQSSMINRTTPQWPKASPFSYPGSQLILLLMDMNPGWWFLEVSQIQCFVWQHQASFLISVVSWFLFSSLIHRRIVASLLNLSGFLNSEPFTLPAVVEANFNMYQKPFWGWNMTFH